MERRYHSVNETAMMHKAYYFSEWDYCKPCRHIQHYEKFKVHNDHLKQMTAGYELISTSKAIKRYELL
jgi:hypothetical protein